MKLLHQGDGRFSVEIIRHYRGLRLGLAFLLAVQALPTGTCRAAEGVPEVHPPSKWVMPRTFDRPLPGDLPAPSQGSRWLLHDRQINAQLDEEFVHEVRQTLTPAGIQEASRIFINYDPACQSLTLHWARIWRGLNKLDRLDASTMRLNEAAPGAKEWLFGSIKTAVLPIDGVRVGDIVDYAYTIEGRNPALGAKFCDAVQLQFGEPVDRAVTRLVWPFSRRLFYTNFLTSIPPTVLRRSNTIEYTWDARKVPGLQMEPLTPAWYQPYAYVQLSDFQSWDEVSRWALRLFTTNSRLSLELTKRINQWKSLPDPGDRVTAALRYVQEEIRSSSPEDNAAGYEVAQPSAVFARRFGNDKDKSFLLVTILRALQIQAFPVLVNDRRGQQFAAQLPSPLPFDHVIVQINLGGQSFWLDPTGSYERGLLTLRYWPNYGWGLMVGHPANVLTLTPPGLTPIPPCPVQPLTSVSEYLNVGVNNSESTAKIVSIFQGPDADSLRRRLATTPREDIDRENLEAYARHHPFIRSTSPTLYVDDERQNRIESTENYALDKIWNRLPDNSGYRLRIYAVALSEILRKPPASFRVMPLAAPYPAHQFFHAEINVSALPTDSDNVTIDSPAFYFRRTANINSQGNHLLLDFEYRSRSDAIAADAVPAYVNNMGAAIDALGYTLIGTW